MMRQMRKLVSKDRIRFQDSGFDLDLSYITRNIVAMSFPSTGLTAVWRNPIGEVMRLLNTKHPNAFMIWNLSGDKYDYESFQNQILEFPFEDHHAPPLEYLFAIVKSVDSWISADPALNVAFVHCKGGKGRTGVVVVCWLLYGAVFTDIARCAQEFARLRSSTAKGVTQPSQVRYLTYFSEVLTGTPLIRRPLLATCLKLSHAPLDWLPSKETGNISPIEVQVCQYGNATGMMSAEPVVVYRSRPDDAGVVSNSPRGAEKKLEGGDAFLEFRFPSLLPLQGDVLVRVFYRAADEEEGDSADKDKEGSGGGTGKKRKEAFHAIFHTAFVWPGNNTVSFTRRGLDSGEKRLSEQFCVTLEVSHVAIDANAPASVAETMRESPIIEQMRAKWKSRMRKATEQADAAASTTPTTTTMTITTPSTTPQPAEQQQAMQGTEAEVAEELDERQRDLEQKITVSLTSDARRKSMMTSSSSSQPTILPSSPSSSSSSSSSPLATGWAKPANSPKSSQRASAYLLGASTQHRGSLSGTAALLKKPKLPNKDNKALETASPLLSKEEEEEDRVDVRDGEEEGEERYEQKEEEEEEESFGDLSSPKSEMVARPLNQSFDSSMMSHRSLQLIELSSPTLTATTTTTTTTTAATETATSSLNQQVTRCSSVPYFTPTQQVPTPPSPHLPSPAAAPSTSPLNAVIAATKSLISLPTVPTTTTESPLRTSQQHFASIEPIPRNAIAPPPSRIIIGSRQRAGSQSQQQLPTQSSAKPK